MLASIAQSLRKLVEFMRLIKEILRTCLQIAFAITRRAAVAEDDKRDAGCGMPNRTQHLQTGAAFKLNIQHHDVRAHGKNALNRTLRGVCLTDDPHGAAGQH